MTRVALTFSTADVVASPADDTETVVAILHGVTCQFAGDTFKLHGFVGIELDTDATLAFVRIRRDSIAGDEVGIGTLTPQNAAAAGNSLPCVMDANDTPGDVANMVYVLTVECADATGPSTVDSATLSARCD